MVAFSRVASLQIFGGEVTAAQDGLFAHVMSGILLPDDSKKAKVISP